MRVLADIYWNILLSFALVIILFALGYGVIELSSVTGKNGALNQSTETQSIPKFNRTQLQNTLDAFGQRQVRFSSFKTVTQKISDPSR